LRDFDWLTVSRFAPLANGSNRRRIQPVDATH
jgi:hypothetical protein